MQHLILEISKEGKAKMAFLGAQTHTLSFYEQLGFQVCSEEYLDAGIPHKGMKLIFTK